MALIRFSPELDQMSGLLGLQSELERFLRNPAFSMGLSGAGAYPPLNIFEDGEQLVTIAELPGLDPAAVQVSGQGRTLTISSERQPIETGATPPIIAGNARSGSSRAPSRCPRDSTWRKLPQPTRPAC